MRKFVSVFVIAMLLVSPVYGNPYQTLGYLLNGANYYNMLCDYTEELIDGVPKRGKHTDRVQHYFKINVTEESTITWTLVNPSPISYRLLVSKMDNACYDHPQSFTDMHCQIRSSITGTGLDSQFHLCKITVPPGIYYGAVQIQHTSPVNNIGAYYFITANVEPSS